MQNRLGFTFLVLLAVAACSSKSESGRAPSAPPVGAASQKPESYVPAGQMLSDVVTTEAWSTESDREQHERYHWPASFQVPIEYRIDTPEVPAEIANPSPPINVPK